jgi:hypothetical protein
MKIQPGFFVNPKLGSIFDKQLQKTNRTSCGRKNGAQSL